MKYDVIENASIDYLIKAVNERIEEGWQPIGGISILECDGDYWHAQAIIKTDG